MSLSNPKTAISEQDLKDFYDKIKPFLAPKTYAGFTPIGTIISIFGESAPANYLICDGSTYNVADYPELCAHLWSLTTNSQYKVSGDATKFKVPDLRGEFLRGTGTNIHTNSGNGSAVGVHQDATASPLILKWSDNKLYVGGKDDAGITTVNPDKRYNVATNTGRAIYNSSTTDTFTTDPTHYTARPTNTSVLFCIATKNIYLDPKNDYSTEEKVIGSWIDGKTIYQKTLALDNVTGTTAGTFVTISNDISSLGIGAIVDIRGILLFNNVYQTIDFRESNSGGQVKLQTTTTSLQLITNLAIDGAKYWVTIQYTKTT